MRRNQNYRKAGISARKANIKFNKEELKEEKTYVSPSPESRPEHPSNTHFLDWDVKIKNVVERMRNDKNKQKDMKSWEIK